MDNIKRINPHQLQQGFIGPNGIKRIARGVSASSLHTDYKQNLSLEPAVKQLAIEKADSYVMVFLHSKDGMLSTLDKEVLYVARVLAGRKPKCAVLTVVFGEIESDLRQHGSDRVIILNQSVYQGYAAVVKTKALADIRKKFSPDYILCGEGYGGDSELARRLAVSENASIATNVIEIDDKKLRRVCDNGRQQAVRELTNIIVLTGGVADSELDFTTEARMEEWNLAEEINDYRGDTYSVPAQELPLEEANFILSAGNGIANMETFKQLANSLECSIAGSRVVVDDGKLPREMQVGATGKIVSSSVYIAVGISGAVQHLQGIKDCGNVIAVNLDDSCDMVKRADLSLICDAEEWMQEMIKLSAKNNPSANPSVNPSVSDKDIKSA